VGQFVFRLVRGELDEAEPIADEIRYLGDAQNQGPPKFIGALVSGNVCCWRGKFADARGYHETALELWDPIYRRLIRQPEDGYVLTLVMLSLTLLCLGYIDQARLQREKALVEARRLGAFNLGIALMLSWPVDWRLCGIKSASSTLKAADEMIAIASEEGYPQWLGPGKIMRGVYLGANGQAEQGLTLILEGTRINSAMGNRLMKPFYLMTLAETYSHAGQPKEALHQIVESAKLIEMTQERWAEAEVHRMRGTLLRTLDEHTTAEECYLNALDKARGQRAKFWELRAALDLAQLWRDQGKRREARDLLAPVYDWFTEGFDTFDLKEAKMLLDELHA
jgi:tetratricopeptide (TPR) repeat protein